MPFAQRKRGTCSKNSHLKPKECCILAVVALDRHLIIPIQGRLTQLRLFQALVGMAAMHQSVHSITGFLDRVPCETSFRYHLKKLDMSKVEQKSTATLTHFVQDVLKPGTVYQFAIDYTNDPYYGETTDENKPFVIRSKRKKSTNEFYSYVTLYVTPKDQQMTLAVYPVQQRTTKVGYIARCLDRIAELGLMIKVLRLDREFYTWKVFGFLTRVEVPFIVPTKKQSARMKELLQGTTSRYAEYRMGTKPPVLLMIAVAVRYAQGKQGKHGVENPGYVVGGLDWHPLQVHRFYRSRFSIESSYRMRNQVKPRTGTRNPVIRYLYVIISFLLKNIWIVLLWRYFSPVKRGPRTIDMRTFRFERFVVMIGEGIRKSMGIVKEIPVLRLPV